MVACCDSFHSGTSFWCESWPSGIQSGHDLSGIPATGCEWPAKQLVWSGGTSAVLPHPHDHLLVFHKQHTWVGDGQKCPQRPFCCFTSVPGSHQWKNTSTLANHHEIDFHFRSYWTPEAVFTTTWTSGGHAFAKPFLILKLLLHGANYAKYQFYQPSLYSH